MPNADKKVQITCPCCHTGEGVQKVSAIVAGGTSVNHSERVIPITYSGSVVSPISLGHSSGYSNGYTESQQVYTRLETVQETSTSMSVIAQRLAFPGERTLINIFSTKNPPPTPPKPSTPGVEKDLFSAIVAVFLGLIIYVLFEGWVLSLIVSVFLYFKLQPYVTYSPE